MRTALPVLALLMLPASASALGASYEVPAEFPPIEQLFEGGFVTSFLFDDDGTIIWADLHGNVTRFDPVTKQKTKLIDTDAIVGLEWGLTGLAKDEDGAIYTLYTTGPEGVDPDKDDVNGELRVSRWEDGKEKIIFVTNATRSHNGGRLLWHDGTLFVTLGEHTRGSEPMSKRMTAQDPGSLGGKVLRMLRDGSPAPGNPAETNPLFHPLVYSYGHRNPFGIAWDTKRDTLVLSDPAQNFNEEINHVPKGGNLGWPLCVGPCNPPNASLIDPIVLYPETITPVGMSVVGDDYYVGGFNDAQVRRIYETPNGWTDEIVTEVDAGMLDVGGSPDGKWIYVGTWNGLWRFPTPGNEAPGSTTTSSQARGSSAENPVRPEPIPGFAAIAIIVAAAGAVVALRRRA